MSKDTKRAALVQLDLFNPSQSIPSAKAEPVRIEHPEFSDNIRRQELNGVDYYSLVDIMIEITDTTEAKRYWSDTKRRLKRDGFDAYDRIVRISMLDKTGKRHQKTDCADRQTCLRIVQSIPSPKAEPIRQWLASLGDREITEAEDPEQAIHRSLDNAVERYTRQGKDNEWIAERLRGMDSRRVLTDAIKGAIQDMPDNMYAQSTETVYRGLWERTSAIMRAEFNMPQKGGNVRDHFGTYALIYTGLAERLAGDMIEQAGELTPAIAMEIIWKIAVMIKSQAQSTAEFLGRDLLTDKKLLKDGKS